MLHHGAAFANPGLNCIHETVIAAEYRVGMAAWRLDQSINTTRAIRGMGRWDMKEYKLLSWPDLPSEFRRTGYRRLLSELSQRHVGESTLMRRDGLRPAEVRALLQFLSQRDLLDVREAAPAVRGWMLPAWWRRLRASA